MKRKAKIDKNEALYNCQYQACWTAVNSLFNNDTKTTHWMYIRNPLLGDVTPVSMLQAGRFDKLIDFILNSLEENIR